MLPDIHRQVQEMEKKWAEMERCKEMENKVNELQAEQIWSKVTAIERNRDNELEKANDFEAKMQSAVEQIRIKKKLNSGLQDLMEKLNCRAEVAVENMKPLHVKDQELYAKERELNDALGYMKGESNDITTEIRKHQESIADLESRIRQENQKLNIDHQAIANDRNHQIRVLQKHIDAESAKRSEACQEIDNLGKETPELERKVQIAEDSVNRMKREVDQTRNHIREINAQMNDRLSAFGNSMSHVVRDINASRWVGSKPVGPFGCHISLNDQKFRVVIESYLSRILNSFCVENDQDYRQLQSILQKHRCQAGIYKYRAKKDFDFSSGQPAKNLRTILDVLQVSWINLD